MGASTTALINSEQSLATKVCVLITYAFNCLFTLNAKNSIDKRNFCVIKAC